MPESLDVYWSFRSPYSYLVTPDLLQIREDFDVEVNLRVVLPVAVRSKETLFDPSNLKPIKYILLDSNRRAEFLGLPFVWPTKPDPVVQDYKTFEVAEDQPYIFRLCKLGVEAQRRGKGPDLAAAISRLIFGGTVGWDQGPLEEAVASVGLNLDELDKSIDDGDHLEEVEQNQKNLDAVGHWGVPTMVIRDEPFFGQDRIETLRWRMDQYGLRSSEVG